MKIKRIRIIGFYATAVLALLALYPIVIFISGLLIMGYCELTGTSTDIAVGLIPFSIPIYVIWAVLILTLIAHSIGKIEDDEPGKGVIFRIVEKSLKPIPN